MLNALWDWAVARARQGRAHPYYVAFAQDMFALVRSCGREEKPRP